MKKLLIVLLLFLFVGILYSQTYFSRKKSPLHVGLNQATNNTTLGTDGDCDTLNFYVDFGASIKHVLHFWCCELIAKYDTTSFYVAADSGAKSKGKEPAIKIDWAYWDPLNDEVLYTNGVTSAYHAITDSMQGHDKWLRWFVGDSIDYCSGLKIRFSFGDDSLTIPSIIDTFRRYNIEYIFNLR